jgi:hypothetical protein
MRLAALLSLLVACDATGASTSGGTDGTTTGGTTGGTTTGGTTGGTTTGGTTTTGGGGISLDDYCAAIPAHVCSTFYQGRCAVYSSEAACEAALVTFTSWCPQMKREIAAGRVAYDAVLAKSCPGGAWVDTLTCDEIMQWPPLAPPCNRVFVGQIADGGACYADADCAATSYCDLGIACSGTCKPMKSVGQSVSGTDRCLPNLTIIQGVCAQPIAAGQPCPNYLTCAWGSTCDGTTCQPWKKAGESCADPAIAGSTGFCGGELSCQNGVCGPPAALGASCFHPSWVKVQHADCERDLWCDDMGGTATGTCKRPLAQGGACADYYDCNAGLTCVGFSGGSMPVYGQCVPLLGAGAGCQSWIDCQSGLYCDNSSHTCVARKAGGAACMSFVECASDSCVNGQCAAVCP